MGRAARGVAALNTVLRRARGRRTRVDDAATDDGNGTSSADDDVGAAITRDDDDKEEEEEEEEEEEAVVESSVGRGRFSPTLGRVGASPILWRRRQMRPNSVARFRPAITALTSWTEVLMSSAASSQEQYSATTSSFRVSSRMGR